MSELHTNYILSSFYGQQDHGSLGETVKSAIVAIKKARLRLENPLFPEKERTKEEQIQRVREKEFYDLLLKKLE